MLEGEEVCRAGIIPSGADGYPNGLAAVKRCLGVAGAPFSENGLLSGAFDPGRRHWQDGLQEGDSSLPTCQV